MHPLLRPLRQALLLVVPANECAFHTTVDVGAPLQLWVEGAGSAGLLLPLSQEDAAKVEASDFAVESPFGAGEETKTDARVRRSRQVEPRHFRVLCAGGAATRLFWDGLIPKATRDACAALGVAADQIADVRAVPYKLLLYGPGGHFAYHQDSEKCDGMFGTLILQLPSRFAGGAYAVRSNGKEATFELSERAERTCHVVAHYADVEHALQPLTGGHRAAVVYQLVLDGAVRRGAAAAGDAPMAATSDGGDVTSDDGGDYDIADDSDPGEERTATAAESMATLRSGLAAWRRSAADSAPDCCALVLRQQYTQAALRQGGVGALKGADRARAEAVLAANAALGGAVDAFIVQAEREVKFRPKDGEDVWDEDTGRRFPTRGGWNTEDEECSEEGGSSEEMSDAASRDTDDAFEPEESSIRAQQGQLCVPLAAGAAPLSATWKLDGEQELLDVEDARSSYRWGGDEDEVSVADIEAAWGPNVECSGIIPTGNEGVEMERWYRRFMLVLRRRH